MGSQPPEPPAREGRLLTLLDELREMERRTAMANTAATIGHVIGTPLNVISGRAALIRAGQDSASAADNARRIVEQVDRLATRVHAVIAHLHERVPEPVERSASAIVEEALALYGPVAAERHGELCLEGDVPRAQINESAMAAVVLTSLLSLAVRYGEPRTKATLRARRGENAVVFEVEAPALVPPAGAIDRMELPEGRTERGDVRLQVLTLAHATAKRIGGSLSVEARSQGGALLALTWPAT